MPVRDTVLKAIAAFERAEPSCKRSAYCSAGGGSRTWEQQLDIILDPIRAANYPNIKKRFLAANPSLQNRLPSSRGDLSDAQLTWWRREIMAQAGKPKGFAHIGGKAQDVSVKKLTYAQKKKLKTEIEKLGLKILNERVTGTTSEYGVSLTSANVFHVHE